MKLCTPSSSQLSLPPEELFQSISSLPAGTRKVLREWGNLIASGIADATKDAQVPHNGVLDVIIGTPFDPKRKLLLLEKDDKKNVEQHIDAVNNTLGEELLTLVNNREYSLPSDRVHKWELEQYTVVKIHYNPEVLSGILQKLPMGANKAQARLITRDGSGEYFFRGQHFVFKNKDTNYFLVFEYLFNKSSGEATYEEIDTVLARNSKGSIEDPRKMRERVRNTIRQYERDKNLPQEIDGNKVLKVMSAHGVRLYNPDL